MDETPKIDTRSWNDNGREAVRVRNAHRNPFERMAKLHGLDGAMSFSAVKKPPKPKNHEASLLGLPAEVRTRIYEFALGGHNLHLFCRRSGIDMSPDHWTTTYHSAEQTGDGREYQFRQGYWFQDAICQHPLSDEKAYSLSVEDPVENKYGWICKPGGTGPFEIETYGERHEKCFDVDTFKYRKVAYRKRPTRLPVTLLRTCKQIYDESCLIPYYDNTFSFASGEDLDIFVTRVLEPRQRRVLQHVHITQETRSVLQTYRLPQLFESSSVVFKGLEQKTTALLTGLKTLTLTLDCDEYHTTRSDALLDVPRFPHGGVKVGVLWRKDDYYDKRRHRGARAVAEELEFALVKPLAEVASHDEAREQIEKAKQSLLVSEEEM